MNHYVYIKHPITGDRIVALPTGKTRQRQSESKEDEAEVGDFIEAEVVVLTPNGLRNRI